MAIQKDRILVVDDEPMIRKLLTQKLATEHYVFDEAGNAQEAIDKLKAHVFSLVLLDNKMPGRSGIELLPEIISNYPETAVIMATATADIGIAIRCMKQGAYDYITKPFDLDEVVISVSRALERRRLVLENEDYKHHLEEKVAEQTGRIRTLYLNAIMSLANALEAKDPYTSGHSQRVSQISAAVALALGFNTESVEKVRIAGLLHDIGKIGVREIILNKPARLTPEEFQQTQQHPGIGEHILTPIANDEELLKMVRGHHEHYDGTGYPDGLQGEQISLGARILAAADAYEAMTSARPYRDALGDDKARRELMRHSGTQFDPIIVKILVEDKWQHHVQNNAANNT